MKKTEILADIESKVLKVISTTEDTEDTAKQNAGVRSYVTNVMEQKGDTIHARNIGWYTIDEDGAEEVALYRDILVPKNKARDAVISYLESKSPAPYIRFRNVEVDEENLSATAEVIKDNGDGTATEKRVFIFKNGAKAIEHVELT